MVYQDARYGNSDIFAYNIVTGVERRITTNTADQGWPRISGNLIAWQDYRNGNRDIYGYDLSTSQEFVIANEASDETLIGVDDGYVAFTRPYYTIPANEISGYRTLRNLWLYNRVPRAARTSHGSRPIPATVPCTPSTRPLISAANGCFGGSSCRSGLSVRAGCRRIFACGAWRWCRYGTGPGDEWWRHRRCR